MLEIAPYRMLFLLSQGALSFIFEGFSRYLPPQWQPFSSAVLMQAYGFDATVTCIWANIHSNFYKNQQLTGFNLVHLLCGLKEQPFYKTIFLVFFSNVRRWNLHVSCSYTILKSFPPHQNSKVVGIDNSTEEETHINQRHQKLREKPKSGKTTEPHKSTIYQRNYSRGGESAKLLCIISLTRA